MRRIFAFIMTLTFTCSAEITQITTFDEASKYLESADENTLVIFDVDMVLIQPSDPAFQMPNIHINTPVVKRIISQIPSEKQMMFFSLMTITSPPLLIELKVPDLINELAAKKVKTMALTANVTGSLSTIACMEECRIENLKKLGIDFSKNAPHSEPIVFDDLARYRNSHSNYLEGILFVNGTSVSKGEAFLSFLDKTGLSPKNVIFFDDREENVKSLEQALAKRNISYSGFHYLGASKYPSKQLFPEEFEAKWKELLNLLETLD